MAKKSTKMSNPKTEAAAWFLEDVLDAVSKFRYEAEKLIAKAEAEIEKTNPLRVQRRAV